MAAQVDVSRYQHVAIDHLGRSADEVPDHRPGVGSEDALSSNAPHIRDLKRLGKIENETFNTLKNLGYNLGHNYGLGKKNLSAVFTILMLLAFLVDQVQQMSCWLFQAAWAKLSSKRGLVGKDARVFPYVPG